MKKAGCHQILIEIESGSDVILENIRKPIDREKTVNAIKIARAAGIDSRASFIFGSSGETVETMQETLDFSMQFDPDIAQYNVCAPYPGTRYRRRRRTAIWSPRNGATSSFRRSCSSSPPARTRIVPVLQGPHKQFFMRPKMIVRRLRKISRISHIRDLIHAFFYIVLREKLGTRGEVRRDWLGTRKEDFFDLECYPRHI